MAIMEGEIFGCPQKQGNVFIKSSWLWDFNLPCIMTEVTIFTRLQKYRFRELILEKNQKLSFYLTSILKCHSEFKALDYCFM